MGGAPQRAWRVRDRAPPMREAFPPEARIRACLLPRRWSLHHSITKFGLLPVEQGGLRRTEALGFRCRAIRRSAKEHVCCLMSFTYQKEAKMDIFQLIRFGDMMMTSVLYLVAASGLLVISVMGQGLAFIIAMLIVLEGALLAHRLLHPGAASR